MFCLKLLNFTSKALDTNSRRSYFGDGNHKEVGLTLQSVSCIRDPINFALREGGNNGRNQ